jgi:hypothetical protein
MAVEYYSFEEVLGELDIDEEELKKLVSQGELRGFRDGMSMKFKKEDVVNLKKGRETEPTIILTDSDQEMGIAESSDELILDESTSDTVLNVGDIMMGKESDEIVFADSTEEFAISPHDSDVQAAIPTVEVPTVEEDMGLVETDSDAALVEVGVEEGMETEQFELVEEDETSGVAIAPTKTPSGKISRSARLRAMQMKQRTSHVPWTVTLIFLTAILIFPGIILWNRAAEVQPQWTLNLAGFFKGAVDSIWLMFNG